ncbi:hypothetical protein NPIL_120341 [Nephila pilipes]|uniref:Uncharacterized protein n=1 Tax=Nephila pilipes TaxID=299642 RepID=A0A8X6NM78_NEPPI|nr:hypothetical protein NPIL_120341 [Nephila pilipes]
MPARVEKKNFSWITKSGPLFGLQMDTNYSNDKMNSSEKEQPLNHKDAGLQMLKETLDALESKMSATAETHNNTTIKIIKIKRVPNSLQKSQGKKVKPIELTNKFKALKVDETPVQNELNETQPQTKLNENRKEIKTDVNNENREEKITSPTQEIKPKRIPPIIIDEALNTPPLMDEIS